MIYVRAVHFAATIAVTGVVFFWVFIAEPAFRGSGSDAGISTAVRRRLAWIAWIGLALAVISGAVWLVFVAETMSEESLSEVLSEGILRIVLLHTDFGRDWLLRLVLAAILAAAFIPFLSARRVKLNRIKTAAIVLAAGLVGSLAWAGHAIGAPGIEGIVHPAADVLHLIAAAAWVGTLVPLALLLAATGHDATSVAIARTATVRFSTFGIVSVATILITGGINAYYLVGSVAALAETDYGHLLLAKIFLFLGMVIIAAINRLQLKPRLEGEAGAAASRAALRQLRRNILVEVAMGVTIIAIVAALGITPPGLHEELVPNVHHSH